MDGDSRVGTGFTSVWILNDRQENRAEKADIRLYIPVVRIRNFMLMEFD